MTFKLEGKKVFITGSTSGIGLVIAKKMQSFGCLVAINSSNKSSLLKANKEFEKPVLPILGDMSVEKDAKKAIEEFIEKYKILDILICNIGSGKSAKPLNENSNDWEESFAINLKSATNVISAAKSYLSNTSGSITCISSICGNRMIENAPLTYSSMKSALNTYVKNSSFYLAKNKIRINAIAPGNVFFRGSIWEKKLQENPKKVTEMLKEKVPLNKFIIPEEIADAVAFISCPLASSITGQILNVDAGQSIL